MDIKKGAKKLAEQIKETIIGIAFMIGMLYLIYFIIPTAVTTVVDPNPALDYPAPDTASLTTGPKETLLPYTIDGTNYVLTSVFYKGLNDYLASIPRSISSYSPESLTTKDFAMRLLENPYQKQGLESFVNYINNMNLPPEKKVRLVVSLVQNMPYDFTAANTNNVSGKYPYEVLYTNTGVCGEKAPLLVYLLRGLGYGTALIDFAPENHEAVGIKCPVYYSFQGSGYCFIESTQPSIITFQPDTYVDVGRLYSKPNIIEINEGNSFDAVAEDFKDAQRYSILEKLLPGHSKNTLKSDYQEWVALRNKYGLNQTSCDSGKNLCNGECWGTCETHRTFRCDPEIGGVCDWDPKNCPTDMISCNNTCWPKCNRGVFSCQSDGGHCTIYN